MSKEILKCQGELLSKLNELRSTDYKLLKFMDGELTEAQYEPTKRQRAALRARIRELEAAINGGK